MPWHNPTSEELDSWEKEEAIALFDIIVGEEDELNGAVEMTFDEWTDRPELEIGMIAREIIDDTLEKLRQRLFRQLDEARRRHEIRLIEEDNGEVK
jgi:hypothetical protein